MISSPGSHDQQRALVTARRARKGVLLGERARRWGGPPGLTGGDGTAIAVAAAREATAEERTPGGTSAYASESEEEPLAWQPRGPRSGARPGHGIKRLSRNLAW